MWSAKEKKIGLTWYGTLCVKYTVYFQHVNDFLILMSYSNIWPIGKKIKSLNWTIMLWENTLNIVQPGVIDWIKYALCFYVQGHALYLQTCEISGPLNLLSLGLCTCLLTPGGSCPRYLQTHSLVSSKLLSNCVFSEAFPTSLKTVMLTPVPKL